MTAAVTSGAPPAPAGTLVSGPATAALDRSAATAEPGGPVRVDLVVPTLGRPTLQSLLDALADGAPAGDVGAERGRRARVELGAVVLVDDRPVPPRTGAAEGVAADGGGGRGGAVATGLGPLPVAVPPALAGHVLTVATGGVGPAGARNRGWQVGTAPWVVFLDDDVVPERGWWSALAEDLAAAPPEVAAVQGRVWVPLPTDRRPTDEERSVAGLATATWITADCAYRRTALAGLAGFDERFPRAYREDSDLALRARRAGWQLRRGGRVVQHPVRPAPWWVSVAHQRGNADDPLMDAVHGRGWRDEAGSPPGRRRRHLVTTAAGATAALAAAWAVAAPRRAGARRPAAVLAGTAGAAWVALTAELAVARVRHTSRQPGHVAAMVATSVAIPPAAVVWWVQGWLRAARLVAGEGRTGLHPPPLAVLFDRDGTLVEDVPYNGDPDAVRLRPGARRAVDLVRAAGLPVGVVTNQSGVQRGLLTGDQVDAVNRRVEELLGPFDVWVVCPHGEDDGCPARKPAPGGLALAAEALGVPVQRSAFIGDIGADMAAADAAGAVGVLVPTPVTRVEERAAAPAVAATVDEAVVRVLRGAVRRRPGTTRRQAHAAGGRR